MKTTASLLAIACGLAMTTAGSAADIRFRGAVTITSATGCAQHAVGDNFKSAYMAVGSDPDRPATTSFSMVSDYAGDLYELETGSPFSQTWTSLRAHGFDAAHHDFNARVRIAGQEPARITDRTQSLQFAGAIENAGDDPGIAGATCVIRFRAAYNRRIGG